GACQTRHHGADRNLGNASDVVVAELLELTEDEHLSIADRQRSDRGVDLRALGLADGDRGRLGRTRVGQVAPGVFRVVEQDLLLRTVLLQPRVARVPDDLEQPRTGAFEAKAPDVAHRPHERVLNDILRIVRVARDPKRQVVGGIEMRHRQLLEAAPVLLITHVWSPQLARPGYRAIYSTSLRSARVLRVS